jgi:para-aminobenzoate synthetase/4-amino-4-deoxychorismate lyase
MLEWRECLHKAAPLLSAARAATTPDLRVGGPRAAPERLAAGVFETVLGVDGSAIRLPDHLARLDRSCRELYGTGLPGDLADRVLEAAKTVPLGRAALRVRVVAAAPLELEVTAAPAAAPAGPLHVRTAVRPAGLWRHKWSDRRWASDPVLFVDADGKVLETERGNVFLLGSNGMLITAPLGDDLLPGVTRRALLDLARDEGRPAELRRFTVDEMTQWPAFWTSSLSGAVPIHSVDGVELPRNDELVAGFAAALSSGGQTRR